MIGKTVMGGNPDSPSYSVDRLWGTKWYWQLVTRNRDEAERYFEKEVNRIKRGAVRLCGPGDILLRYKEVTVPKFLRREPLSLP